MCVRGGGQYSKMLEKTQTNQKELGVNGDGIFMCVTSRHATSAAATSSQRSAHANVHTHTS